jgi:hypothetical protein
MLQSVEVLPGARRALRRAVQLDCQVLSELWDEPVPHRVTDLSPQGMWIETPFPLERGSRLVVAFTPPRWRRDRELVASAVVQRVIVGRREGEHLSPGMGVVFDDLRRHELDELKATLRGLPPPLPRATPTGRHELIWIDMLAA